MAKNELLEDVHGDIDVNPVETDLDSLTEVNNQTRDTAFEDQVTERNNQSISSSQDIESTAEFNDSDIIECAGEDSQLSQASESNGLNRVDNKNGIDNSSYNNLSSNDQVNQLSGQEPTTDNSLKSEGEAVSPNLSGNNQADLSKTALPGSSEGGSFVSGNLPEANQSRRKNNHIVAIAIALALLAGGGAFAYYYNLPEKVAADAVGGLINRSNQIRTSGSLKIRPQGKGADSESLKNYIQVDFKAATNNFDSEFNLDFTFNLQGSSSPIKFSLGSVVQKNGVFYVSLDKLAEGFKHAVELLDLDYTLDYDSRIALKLIESTLPEIDGKWWKIDVNDLVSSLDRTDYKLEDSMKKDITSFYGCTVNALQQELGKTKEFTNNYLKNPFISVSGVKKETLKDTAFNDQLKDFGNLYKISVDAEKLVQFYKAQNQTISKDAIIDCFRKSNSLRHVADQFRDSITEADGSIKTQAEELAKNVSGVYLGIHPLTHQLKGVYLSRTEDSTEFSGYLNFDYAKNPTIKIPDSAQSITEAVSRLFDKKSKSQDPTLKYLFRSYMLDNSSLFDRSNLHYDDNHLD